MRPLGLLLALLSTPALAEGIPAVTDWRLVALDGKAPVAAVTLTLAEDGAVSGQGPCNLYTALWRVEGEGIALGEIGATKMACPELAEEGAFFAALSATTAAVMDKDLLTLSGGDHSLVFAPPAP